MKLRTRESRRTQRRVDIGSAEGHQSGPREKKIEGNWMERRMDRAAENGRNDTLRHGGDPTQQLPACSRKANEAWCRADEAAARARRRSRAVHEREAIGENAEGEGAAVKSGRVVLTCVAP